MIQDIAHKLAYRTKIEAEDAPKALRDSEPFSDKESYLRWVAEWKAEYAALAIEQRQRRVDLHKPHTEASSWLQVEAHRASRTLYAMLLLRAAGKALSSEMRSAALIVEAV